MTWKKSDGRSLRGAVTVTKTVTIARDGGQTVETSAPRPTRTLGKRGPALSFPKAPKPWRSEPYKKFVREHPCVFHIGGRCDGPIDAHHQGKHAMSEKTDDSRCVPLCRHHHRQVTDGGWVTDMVGVEGGAPRVLTELEMLLVSVNILVEWTRNKEKSR